MLTNQDEIRERIIQIRKERGLSQNQLAKDFGISRTHYCNVENGKKPVTESFLKVLASGYKIPMEAFIPNENGDLMQYCECTNDFVNAIIDEYFNSFEIRKYYIDEYEQLDCQHFFRQIFLGYFSDIVQAFDTLRKNVCGDDYTSLHNPIVLSSVLPAYGMFHSIQILFL